MWLPYSPSVRASYAFATATALTALAGFVARGPLVGWLSGGCVVVLVLLDGVLLARRKIPLVERPAELATSVRRHTRLPLALHDVRFPLRVAAHVPYTLGGPIHPVWVRPGPGICEAHWNVTPRRRGVVEIERIWVTDRGPLGLVVRRSALCCPTRVTVLPDLRGPAGDSVGSEREGERRSLASGAVRSGSELRALRPFQSGDDPRHVDWKATARLGDPVVREWEQERRRQVMIALDAGRLMRAEHRGETKLDAAMRAMARIALAAEVRGDNVGALIFAAEVLRHIPMLSGSGQAERLLRFVNDVQPTHAESDLGNALPWLLGTRRRSLVVVVSDVIDHNGATSLVSAVTQLAACHVPVVALLRDPHLDEAFALPVQAPRAVYRRTAAELVARHRADAIDHLRARGIRALDLSMRALALELVQVYVNVHRGGWL